MAGAFLKLKFMQQQISTNWEKDFKEGHNNLSPTEANEIIAWIKSVFGILPPCPEKEEKPQIVSKVKIFETAIREFGIDAALEYFNVPEEKKEFFRNELTPDNEK